MAESTIKPSDSKLKMPFDTSEEATSKRNFRYLRVTRKYVEECRVKRAKFLEEKKRLPRVINKICDNPTNPSQDCFAMTLEVASSFDAPEIKMKSSVMPAVIVKRRQCLAPIRHEVFVELGKAIQFYQAAFGAELKHSHQSWVPEWTTKDPSQVFYRKRAEFKICSDVFMISDSEDVPSPPISHLFYLLTDDVDYVLERAVKAGASVLGKLVQVYSKCQIWCTLVRINDPYGNQWIIYSRLCSSCLQSFALLA